jgi:hypothetical protein
MEDVARLRHKTGCPNILAIYVIGPDGVAMRPEQLDLIAAVAFLATFES